MRALLLESASDGLLDLALRGQAQGHEIFYHCGSFDSVRNPVGRGLVHRVSDWREVVNRCDLIVCGSTRWMRELDAIRATGRPVIGGSEKIAELELNRIAGMNAFRRKGIAIPPYRQCMNPDEALRYIAQRDEGAAVKPSGDVADKSLSFVAKEARELVWRLESWKRQGKRFPTGFVVQDLVKGVEFGIGAWVTDHGFLPGWEENFEEKRMFPGGGGPNTGELGSIIRLVRNSKLAKQVLAPFEDYLTTSGYRGCIDVNCIISVDDDGTAFPLEWTARLGWPAFNIECALHTGDILEFLAAVAKGRPVNSRRLDEVAVGVVQALPPFPYGFAKPEEIVGVPIWDTGRTDGLHLVNAMRGPVPVIEDGKIKKVDGIVTAGDYVCVVTGTGATVQDARRSAYSRLDRVHMPADDFHRPDIGSRLARQLPQLQEHGYAVGMTYA